jgi:hypothetical protein
LLAGTEPPPEKRLKQVSLELCTDLFACLWRFVYLHVLEQCFMSLQHTDWLCGCRPNLVVVLSRKKNMQLMVCHSGHQHERENWWRYVYVCVYMYVCVCIYIYIYIYIYMHASTPCLCVCVYWYMYEYCCQKAMDVLVHASIHALSVCVCTYVCVCVCMYVCMYEGSYTNTVICSYTNTVIWKLQVLLYI